jgi:p-cumic aldehyde dehydrogenase
MRPLDRARIIETIARKIEENAELALLESYDNGKAVHHALAVDVPAAVDIFRYMAGWCSKIGGQVNPISGDGRQYHSYSLREPIGVVGQIVPWNYPLAMAAWKIATALAAGCTIVLKPSEVTPLTALRLAELALEAGLPEGVLNIVTGYGHEAGQALVEHPGVDKIAFTGSTRVGKQIVQTAARDLKRVTLELGGKSPSLIFADADLDKAAIGAALAIFFNSGQVCLAASRLYVERSVFDRWWKASRRRPKASSWAMAAIPTRCWARWCPAPSSGACWTISSRAAPAGRKWSPAAAPGLTRVISSNPPSLPIPIPMPRSCARKSSARCWSPRLSMTPKR